MSNSNIDQRNVVLMQCMLSNVLRVIYSANRILSLWAVSCIQLWFYIEVWVIQSYQTCLPLKKDVQKYYDTDKLWLKIFVVLLWILNTIYIILTFKFLYVYFVKEIGNPDFLDNLPK